MGHLMEKLGQSKKCSLESQLFGEKPVVLFCSLLGWLVVEPTHLQNISQIGNLPQVGVKMKYL